MCRTPRRRIFGFIGGKGSPGDVVKADGAGCRWRLEGVVALGSFFFFCFGGLFS